MKKLFISSLLLCLCLGVKAQNIVSLSSVSGNPYSEVEVSVSLQNSDDITAFELSIPLTDMTKYVEGSAILSANRSNGHAISADARDNKLTILIYSMALAPLNGSEGELCSFKLKLGREPANYTLTPDVLLGDASGNSIEGSAESGVVTILTPKIEVTTPSIDYGSVPIRSTYNKTLTIKNVGTEPLEITDITFDRSDISASQTIVTIAPQTSQNVTLLYSPMERGSVECNVTITSNAINSTEGKAIVKAQPFSVNELHVQRVQGVSDEEVTVVLKMNNMEPIVAAQCNFTMPDQLVYVEGSAMAGSRCSESDHVAQGIMQGKNLTLLLYSPTNTALPEGDGEFIAFKVKLNGTSGSYKLNPLDVVLSNATMENMTSATTGEYVVIQSPKFSGDNSLSFGSTPVTEKARATYSIYNNNANVNLVISDVAFLAEGYAVESELPMTIAPRKTQYLEISYTPTVEGDYSTTMQVYTNDPLNRMKSVALSGSIYEPNSLSLSGDNTKEGYDVSVSMNNYTDIVAIQMNVNWLEGMKTSSSAMTISERLKNHSYLVTDAGNGTYQILIYSMNNTPIADKAGELFKLSYTAEEGVEYKDSEITINSIVLSDASGKNYVSSNESKTTAVFSNYTIKFEVEGQTLKEEFLKVGSAVIAPEVEEREGYSFAWSEYPETMPANDLNIVGNYTINSYKLTYLVDGEEFATDSITYSNEIVLREQPTKEGYTFSGWSEAPSTMPANDVEITGTFSINTYKVTYLVDGEEYESATLTYGTAIELIAEPTKEGYTFSGWSNVPEQMPANDVEITGTFTINSYKVTYLVDGEEFATDSITYSNEIVLREQPTKEGYTFSGWSEAPEQMPANDVEITGTFTINSYKVTYLVDGEEYESATLTYGTAIELIAEPTKEGYTFSGWSESPVTMPANDVEITGTFIINSYKVTYLVDGEEYAVDTLNYNTSIVLREQPTKEGYTFSGWSEAPSTMPAGDVEITGTFTINSYKVTYLVDGEEYAVDSLEYNTAIVLREQPIKEGYTFSGWSEAPEQMPENDVTVTGTYTINTYKVTYLVDGEEYAVDSLEYNTAIVLREQPIKEGYTFSGWSETPSTMPANDVEIAGIFVINIYSVVVSSTEGGVATASASEAEYNSSVTLTATPDDNYEFVNWTVNGEEVSSESTISVVITLDMEFVANFKKIESSIKESASDLVKIYTANGTIFISNYEGIVRVVTLSGKIIAEQYINDYAQIEINKGIYLILTDNKTYKIVL